METHIVHYSGGICSFFAAKRVVDKMSPAHIILLFADTKIEDEDTYRFLHEGAKYLGLVVTVIADGRTPWEVFKHERYIGNTRADPCSKILKRELLDAWSAQFYPKAIHYFGLDWTEEHRLERLRDRLLADRGIPPERIQAPMTWKPLIDKPDMLFELVKLGIKPPRLYDFGFFHGNCGGFCVKSGQAQFRLLLLTMPERYKHHEEQEEEMRQFLGKDVSILRDRRGGTTKTLTLKQFRERIESGGSHDKHDHGGCGCAID